MAEPVRVQARVQPERSAARWGVLWVVAGMVFALAAQVALLATGFRSLGADDAARVLRASTDGGIGALVQPDVWPPLDEVLFSAALSVWNDPVWAPRIVTGALAIATAGVLVRLAWEMTHDRVVCIATAAMAAVQPHRLIFGVSTMGEAFLLLPTTVAGLFLFRWCRDRHVRDLYVTAAAIGVGTIARYEAWYLAASFGALVLLEYRRGHIRLASVALVAAMVSAFPVVWLAAAALDNGPIEYLSITRQQAATAMPQLERLVFNSAGVRYVLDLLWAPVLLLGAFRLAVSIPRGGVLRSWTLTLFVPLALITASTIATESVPFAAPWRLGAVWLLLTLPISIAEVMRWVRAPRRVLNVAGAALVVLSMVTWVVRTDRITAREPLKQSEIELAGFLGESGRFVLIETPPGEFEYLDLVANSGVPEAFELTVGADPFLVALFIGRLQEWERTEPALTDRLADRRVDLTDVDEALAVACVRQTLVVAKTRQAIEALSAAGVDEVRSSAGWVVFDSASSCPV